MSDFWASPATEPKRSYRFYLEMTPIERWTVKRVKRPDFTMSEVSHEYINHKFWYPGRVEWSPVQVTLVDPITPDTTGILIGMIMASGYRLPTTSVPTRTPNKAEAVAAAGGSIKIIGMAGSPPGPPSASDEYALATDAQVVEQWELVNPWIKSVEFGDYSYSDDAIIDLSCTIRYDFAKYSVMAATGEQADFQTRTGITTGTLGAIMKHGSTLIAGNQKNKKYN